MNKIVIGESSGKDVRIDLDVLLSTRLLLTADSGGGKTFSEPVGRLRSLGIIDYPRQGMVKAADWLFVA